MYLICNKRLSGFNSCAAIVTEKHCNLIYWLVKYDYFSNFLIRKCHTAALIKGKLEI